MIRAGFEVGPACSVGARPGPGAGCGGPLRPSHQPVPPWPLVSFSPVSPSGFLETVGSASSLPSYTGEWPGKWFYGRRVRRMLTPGRGQGPGFLSESDPRITKLVQTAVNFFRSRKEVGRAEISQREKFPERVVLSSSRFPHDAQGLSQT